jgi:hypothetical protein
MTRLACVENLSYLSSSYLLPSLFKKCGYCKLKCKSSSVSSNGGLLSWIPPNDDDGTVDNCGKGISCERSVLFELCIFTAKDNDVRSAGRVVNKDNLVIVREHNLKRGNR